MTSVWPLVFSTYKFCKSKLMCIYIFRLLPANEHNKIHCCNFLDSFILNAIVWKVYVTLTLISCLQSISEDWILQLISACWLFLYRWPGCVNIQMLCKQSERLINLLRGDLIKADWKTWAGFRVPHFLWHRACISFQNTQRVLAGAGLSGYA